MKRFAVLCAGMLVFLMAVPASEARTVYLKDGGRIIAKSAWRTKSRVYILVNRDTLTDFSATEIDLRRTFPVKKRPVIKKSVTETPGAALAAPQTSGAGSVPAEKKQGLSLPSLPSMQTKGQGELPSKDPASLLGENRAKKLKRDVIE